MKKVNRDSIRKITVTGAAQSYSITLPKELMRDLKWRKGQKVIVEKKGKTLVVRDWKR